jgi:hypothetical protein
MRFGLVDEPLRVLDRCRVRWGRVVAADGETVLVRFRPSVWDGSQLELGPHQVERAFAALDGLRLMSLPAPGTWCALHWDWLCSRLTAGQLHQLRGRTLDALDVVNGSPRPARSRPRLTWSRAPWQARPGRRTLTGGRSQA